MDPASQISTSKTVTKRSILPPTSYSLLARQGLCPDPNTSPNTSLDTVLPTPFRCMIVVRRVLIQYNGRACQIGEILESAEDFSRQAWPTHCTTARKRVDAHRDRLQWVRCATTTSFTRFG